MKRTFISMTAALIMAAGISTAGAAGPELPAEIEATPPAVEEYRSQPGQLDRLHFWGYGELHYEGPLGAGQTKQIDFHRFVIGMGYDFTDRIILRSEIDAEHGFKEPELEFAYLDFLLSPGFNIRAGSLLMPVGVINENHEPPTFNGVERPELYVNVIPTTWQEGGAGFHGTVGEGLNYELYAVQALQSVGAVDPRFKASSGLRGGRGHVGEAVGRDIAGVTRFSYTGIPDFRLGISGYAGNTAHGRMERGGLVLLGEADAKYSRAGFDIEGIGAAIRIPDAGAINDANGFTGMASVGQTILGGYGELAYHLLHLVPSETEQDVVLFGRYEWYDTQFRVPTGLTADGDNRRKNIWLGLNYRPIPQVAVKGNYIIRDDAKGGRADKIEVGVGYYF